MFGEKVKKTPKRCILHQVLPIGLTVLGAATDVFSGLFWLSLFLTDVPSEGPHCSRPRKACRSTVTRSAARCASSAATSPPAGSPRGGTTESMGCRGSTGGKVPRLRDKRV